jgi:hypothetical protein
VCENCLPDSDCKKEGHNLRRRFEGCGLLSFQELSPNIASFGPWANRHGPSMQTQSQDEGSSTSDGGGVAE